MKKVSEHHRQDSRIMPLIFQVGRILQQGVDKVWWACAEFVFCLSVKLPAL